MSPEALIFTFAEDIFELPIVQPPMLPTLELIVPDKLADEAVICPDDFSNNPLALISVSLVVNPPINPSLAVTEPLIFASPADVKANPGVLIVPSSKLISVPVVL